MKTKYRNTQILKKTVTPSTFLKYNKLHIKHRINLIEEALQREDTLPPGLRNSINKCLYSLKQLVPEPTASTSYDDVCNLVHEVAYSSFAYGEKILESEAVAQIRVLDLELNTSASEPKRINPNLN